MLAMRNIPDVRRGPTRRQLLVGSAAVVGAGFGPAAVQAAYLVRPWDP